MGRKKKRGQAEKTRQARLGELVQLGLQRQIILLLGDLKQEVGKVVEKIDKQEEKFEGRIDKQEIKFEERMGNIKTKIELGFSTLPVYPSFGWEDVNTAPVPQFANFGTIDESQNQPRVLVEEPPQHPPPPEVPIYSDPLSVQSNNICADFPGWENVANMNELASIFLPSEVGSPNQDGGQPRKRTKRVREVAGKDNENTMDNNASLCIVRYRGTKSLGWWRVMDNWTFLAYDIVHSGE